jgi:hypothetical protein
VSFSAPSSGKQSITFGSGFRSQRLCKLAVAATVNTSPALEIREDREMADASPPPRAPLGSSGSVPALGPQDIAVLVQTVNQQMLAHHQLATTLGVVGKAVGDKVAEMRAGRASDAVASVMQPLRVSL